MQILTDYHFPGPGPLQELLAASRRQHQRHLQQRREQPPVSTTAAVQRATRGCALAAAGVSRALTNLGKTLPVGICAASVGVC